MIIDDKIWSELTSSWPTVQVARKDFEAALDHSSGADGVNSRYIADQYLAFACSTQNAHAIVALRAHLAETLEKVRNRFGSRAQTVDELESMILSHLLVAAPGQKPRILEYSGQAPLKAWVRVVATRLMLSRVRTKQEEPTADEELFERLGLTDGTPERELGKEQGRAMFRKAFSTALTTLATPQRQLLRLAFVEGLTIDDIGALYGFHRTTAFRKIQEASEVLRNAVHAALRSELKLTGEEYEQWCTSLRSGLELSLKRYFSEDSK